MKVVIFYNVFVIYSVFNFENGMVIVLVVRKVGIKFVYEVRGFWYLFRVVKFLKFRNSYWFIYCELMEFVVV